MVWERVPFISRVGLGSGLKERLGEPERVEGLKQVSTFPMFTYHLG